MVGPRTWDVKIGGCWRPLGCDVDSNSGEKTFDVDVDDRSSSNLSQSRRPQSH